MVKTKKKKPADVELIKRLIEQSGLSIYKVECQMKLSKSTILRGLQPDTKRPIPPKWELPIIKFLKKKIAEKQDAELQTEEIKIEMGFTVEEKPSNLKEELKEVKRSWVGMLQG